MRRCWLLLVLAALLGSAEPLTGPEALEHNRRLLEKWRADPEHDQRLQRDLRAFWAMSPERQDRMRRLDRALYDLDATKRKRLLKSLERYGAWLDWLHETEPEAYAQIQGATGTAARLDMIRKVRERQWFDRLPQKERDHLMNLPPAAQAQRMVLLRQQERKQHQLWQKPLRPPFPRWGRPSRLKDFPNDVQIFVNKVLLPHLNEGERAALARAEGKWPQYAHTLLDLSDKHPELPKPPPPRVAITRYEDLPREVKEQLPRRQLQMKKQWFVLHRVEGKWPEFALTCLDLARRNQQAVHFPFGACRPGEFPKPVNDFLSKRLKPALKKGELDRLKRAEGKWPDYPLLLLDLARKHHLNAPGMSLPGPHELWDSVRIPG